jgi:hypothetical protein
MNKYHNQRRALLRKFAERIRTLESKLSCPTLESRDNIFCTGRDAAIFYKITELKTELKGDLAFIDRHFITNQKNTPENEI